MSHLLLDLLRDIHNLVGLKTLCQNSQTFYRWENSRWGIWLELWYQGGVEWQNKALSCIGWRGKTLLTSCQCHSSPSSHNVMFDSSQNDTLGLWARNTAFTKVSVANLQALWTQAHCLRMTSGVPGLQGTLHPRKGFAATLFFSA